MNGDKLNTQNPGWTPSPTSDISTMRELQGM